jgi:hypothetical protein
MNTDRLRQPGEDSQIKGSQVETDRRKQPDQMQPSREKSLQYQIDDLQAFRKADRPTSQG